MSAQAAGDRSRLRLVRDQDGAPEGSQTQAPRPSPSRDDSELLAAVRACDAGAATALHDRVRPTIDRTLRRLLGSRDADFQDFAQMALIELVTTIDRYRGECSLDSWVAMLTSRVVYKGFRRRKLERGLFARASEEELEVIGTQPTGRLTARRLLERIAEHLGAMGRDRAWAYVLHDVCGHDLREVAEILGISVAAAQSRLVRGRKELHDRVQGDGDLASALALEDA